MVAAPMTVPSTSARRPLRRTTTSAANLRPGSARALGPRRP
uniref:Uncharacterized protein n=1 Tax=Arundo donax TaxID=35708 RepID=A0A0A8YD81_ARUDO